MPILMILRATWKIWLPTLAIVLIAGTIWAQGKRINHLREERDVAISEYQRAMVVAQAATADREKLDRLLQERQKDADARERKMSKALAKVAELSRLRPDVRAWVDAPLPAGMWAEIHRAEDPAAGHSFDDGRTGSD
jgi:hypothetical protein